MVGNRLYIYLCVLSSIVVNAPNYSLEITSLYQKEKIQREVYGSLVESVRLDYASIRLFLDFEFSYDISHVG